MDLMISPFMANSEDRTMTEGVAMKHIITQLAPS